MDSKIDRALLMLKEAERCEKDEQLITAASKYFDACVLMKQYLNDDCDGSSSGGSKRKFLLEQIKTYNQHAKDILKGDTARTEEGDVATTMTPARAPRRESWAKKEKGRSYRAVYSTSGNVLGSTKMVEKVVQGNAHLSRALDCDDEGRRLEAVEEYMAAAENFLEAIKLCEDAEVDSEKNFGCSLKRRLKASLDRIEVLKQMERDTSKQSPRGKLQQPREARRPSNSTQIHDPSTSLTPDEIHVLKRSSMMASGLFMPWSETEMRTFDFQSSKIYKDPDGLLPLSPNQKKVFFKWARPAEILSLQNMTHKSVEMVHKITPYTIRQAFVTDCSFIASLCICADYERRFKRKLVTSLIHPQDRNGNPIYNSSGKYVVKFWLNGIPRRVIVDDLFPVDRSGKLLCSHTMKSSNGLELWVSIIEKAYMKLCGGYDFPGSNSGVDLFSLTGWIPERLFFPENKSDIRDHETPTERAWERLNSAASFGDCLMTVSTSSEIAEEVAKRQGLVPGHAYAVLRVVQTKSGVRLLQLKNPWAHKGWKGRYSPLDQETWKNHALRAELNYNPDMASNHDNGIFWISWDDILLYFQNTHLSWNPGLFSAATTVHGLWNKDQGPSDDSFNVGENPQYILTLSDTAIKRKASVWILLSRHVTKQEQEGVEAKDFLTLHVHRNTEKKKTVWYPKDKNRVLGGVYTNNSHVLIRYDVSEPADKYLSLVLSQYQKVNDLGYTLSCYCTSAFTLGRPQSSPREKISLQSEWTPDSAGGPPSGRTYTHNPMWTVTVPRDSQMLVQCSASKEMAVNVMVFKGTADEKKIGKKPVLDSGDYRYGFTVAPLSPIEEGSYTLVASTFEPNQVGRFLLTLYSTSKLSIQQNL